MSLEEERGPDEVESELGGIEAKGEGTASSLEHAPRCVANGGV